MVVHVDRTGLLERRAMVRTHEDKAERPLVVVLLRAIRRRAALAALLFAAATLPLAALIVTLAPNYEAVATLMIEPRVSETSEVNPLQPALAGDEMAIEGEIAVLRSDALVRRLIDHLDLAQAPEFAAALASSGEAAGSPERSRAALADAVARRIHVRRIGESRAIAVGFTARDPELAARAANTLVALYVADGNEVRRERADRNREWLERRLEELGNDLERKERAAATLRETAMRTLGVDADALVGQVEALSLALVDARRRANETDAAVKALDRALADAPRTALALFARPADERLLEAEAESRRQRATLEARFGADHPRVERPREEHEALLRLVRAEADARRATLAAEARLAAENHAAARAELDAANETLARARELSLAQATLDREVAAAGSVLDAFLRRYDETVDIPDYSPSARIVSEAFTPYRKASPSRAVLLAAAFLVGAIGAVGAAGALELAGGGRLRAPADLRLGVGLSCTNVLPRAPRRTRRRVVAVEAGAEPDGRIATAFAGLGATIVAASERGSRPVLVTSPATRDGKTFVANAAALTIATEGRRVLVLRLGAPGAGPLRELASRSFPNGGEILVMEGPAPSALGGGETSAELTIEAAVHRREIVLLDADLGLDDALLAAVAPLRPATVVVARANRTTVASLLDLLARLSSVGLPIQGVVLNRSA